MASYLGNYFKIELSGTSHGPEIGIRISGVPEGTVIDYREIDSMLRRRAGTKRTEPDEIEWRSGVVNFGGEFGIVTNGTVEAAIKNVNQDSSAYDELKYIARPGHADFTAMMKDGLEADIVGGGRFSGRLTVGLTVAGSIAKQLLEKEGIEVMADIVEIAGSDNPIDFEDVIETAGSMGDSVGGIIECGIMGVKPGSCGDAYFEGLEGKISKAVFGIPAVKGIEFGNGFKAARIAGSENNDRFVIKDGKIETVTNNHGGILGGIASGMPIIFRCAIKPTPSISKEQKTVNLKTMEEVTISVKGRHDPCIVPRAVPVVEAVAAIALLDALYEERTKNAALKEKNEDISDGFNEDSIESLRTQIDGQNEIILEAFKTRLSLAQKIGHIKKAKGIEIEDKERETAIIAKMAGNTAEAEKESVAALFENIIQITKEYEKKAVRPFGLLGRSLPHTFSPDVHKKITEITGANYDFVKFEIEPDQLESFVKGQDWEGLNVTIPYKEAVIPFLDELSPEAKAIGAVNTIVRREGKLVGFNTDYYGFKRMLESNGVDVCGRNCLVLGNGGASKAVKEVLFNMDAGSVQVLTHKAIDELNEKKTASSILEAYKEAEIIVNTTPCGMYPEQGKSPVNPGIFSKAKWAVDVIYNPIRTNFICQAGKCGLGTVGGTEMLVNQAVVSSMLFTGRVFENRDEVCEKVTDWILKRKQNIVLIGMPGVGKTTIGKKLAAELNRDFVDTDELIEAREGKSIPDIFRENGEEYFRDIEQLVVSELRGEKGLVISTGGGVINREENYYSLAENGLLVFIKTDEDKLSELAVNGRPVSMSHDIESLYRIRLPKYESWADKEIMRDDNTTADLIFNY